MPVISVRFTPKDLCSLAEGTPAEATAILRATTEALKLATPRAGWRGKMELKAKEIARERPEGAAALKILMEGGVPVGAKDFFLAFRMCDRVLGCVSDEAVDRMIERVLFFEQTGFPAEDWLLRKDSDLTDLTHCWKGCGVAHFFAESFNPKGMAFAQSRGFDMTALNARGESSFALIARQAHLDIDFFERVANPKTPAHRLFSMIRVAQDDPRLSPEARQASETRTRWIEQELATGRFPVDTALSASLIPENWINKQSPELRARFERAVIAGGMAGASAPIPPKSVENNRSRKPLSL